MQVETILKAKGYAVTTIASDQKISEAVALLTSFRIGAVVVLDDDAVVGILSERDIVRHLGSDWAVLAGRPVADIMTKKVITATRADTVASVMALMTDNRIRHMPVVDGRRLVGILSIGDIVKGKIEEAEQEALALKEYIAS